MKTALKNIGGTLVVIAGAILILFAIFGFIAMIAEVVYDMNAPLSFNENHVAYKIKDYQIRSEVEVLEIIREKDKEPISNITLIDIDKKMEIPESTYMEYIGEGNNALTIDASCVKLAVKTAKFGFSWEKAKTYSVYRYKMPWTEDTISFTENEAQQFFDMLSDDKKCFRFYNLPFECSSYGTGWDFDIDQDESYTEWSNRT